MNTSELRKGNLVTVDNENYHPSLKDVPLVVNGFREKPQGGYLVDLINKYNMLDYYQLTKYLKPIRLTKDWLIKLGFETNNNVKYTKGKFTYNINNGWWYGNKKLPNQFIIYVHQLQNLYFALTGEELIIK